MLHMEPIKHLGVGQLEDGVIWDHAAASSNLATQTITTEYLRHLQQSFENFLAINLRNFFDVPRFEVKDAYSNFLS